ncbi:hypothetical protein CR66_03675 [Campylobacter mucosalis]|uniref:Uncharacterized protein n=1 Tax=Campylobacter mucosalis CCUG 21559 TaxID=1032067 RepID=A0A6G5QGP3_9BACT|nr:hypothetical protein [Campylobacter mucosalis]KEA46293.1 hypothetical protein CR66_03675 [Campylobacter mucosalis]QCD44848.1 hypothetical protein CMUC_1067 [Campylobacter mucosalis CCUG 21559]QKF62764.1 hypothetical protein CMCT_0610 [Campylobacter mucosalis]
MSNLITIDEKNILTTGDPKQVEILAKEKTDEIFSAINGLNKKIKEAKELSSEAENSSDKAGMFDKITNFTTGGLFGKNDTDILRARQRLIIKAQSMTNEAVAELAKLQQEAIKLTQISALFSMHMSQHISHIIAKGFKDRDGHIVKLSEQDTQIANYMLESAQKYAEQEIKREQDIKNINNRLDEKSKLDDEQSQAIQENQNTIAKNKDTLARHSEIFKEFKNNKNILDDEQSKLIEQNAQRIANNAEIIAKIQNQSNIKIYLLCVVNFIISVVAIALHFIK